MPVLHVTGRATRTATARAARRIAGATLVVLLLGAMAGCAGETGLRDRRTEDPAAVMPETAALAAALETAWPRRQTRPLRQGPDPPVPRDPSGGTRPLLPRPGAEDAPYPAARFLVVSDPHHLSPSLWEAGEAFARWLSTNDGKVLARSAEVLAALEATIRAEHAAAPLDFVAITGDLSANGSHASHREVASLAERLGSAGIPVFVIPGNHDVNNPWAVRFGETAFEALDPVTPTAFAEIYRNAGYGDARRRAPADLSYRVDLPSGLSLLMLDSAVWNRNAALGYPYTPGAIGTRQREWMTAQLAELRAAGRAPLVFMHHNLLSHGRLRGYATLQYVVDEGPRIARLLWDGGAPVVFTGHIHARNHTGLRGQAGEWIYDLASDAVSLFPHGYRIVEIDRRQRMTVIPRELDGFADAAYREWSLATYLADFVDGAAEGLREELLAATPAESIGEILCAGVDAAADAPRVGTPADCDPEADLTAMATYLAVRSLRHRNGLDGAVIPTERLPATLVDAESLWRRRAPARFDRLLRTWAEDPAPSDGPIEIDLVTGRWRPRR